MRRRLLAVSALWILAAPTFGQQAGDVDLDGYVEDGPSFLVQSVDDQDDIESLVTSIGAVIELGFDVGEDEGADDVRPRLTGHLDHDLEDGDRTTGRIGVDLGLSPIDGIELGGGYEALIGDRDRDEQTVFGHALITS